ncbi:MAG: ankyrin repeat domain-containing protein, partial [Prosthecobacter sp.]|nr:ankyrin repeat domain-containing protein [Prosthecobacter sp.]
MSTLLCLLAAAAAFDSNATSDLAASVQRSDGTAAIAALARGADPNSAPDGVAVLFTAAATGQAGIVGSMLDAGADMDGRSKGKTPLHAAAGLQDATCLKALLDAGADVKAADAEGRTPLHVAVEKASVECVRALVDAGADAQAKDLQGVTALDLAKQGKQTKIAVLLAVPAVTTAKALKISASEDLAAAVQKAADGQVLLLGAGTFSGPLAIRGKAVTLKGDPSGKTV